jgi:hypothetical protein
MKRQETPHDTDEEVTLTTTNLHMITSKGTIQLGSCSVLAGTSREQTSTSWWPLRMVSSGIFHDIMIVDFPQGYNHHW